MFISQDNRFNCLENLQGRMNSIFPTINQWTFWKKLIGCECYHEENMIIWNEYYNKSMISIVIIVILVWRLWTFKWNSFAPSSETNCTTRNGSADMCRTISTRVQMAFANHKSYPFGRVHAKSDWQWNFFFFVECLYVFILKTQNGLKCNWCDSVIGVQLHDSNWVGRLVFHTYADDSCRS